MAKKSITKNFRMSDQTALKLEQLVTLTKIEYAQNKLGNDHDLDYLNQTRIIEMLINREHHRLINELNGPPVSDVLEQHLKKNK